MQDVEKLDLEYADGEKVQMLVDGNEQAFTELFFKYSKKIYFVCRKLQIDHEEAEDVVQKIFLHIWRNRSKLKPHLSFNAYILTITKSVIVKLKRRQAYDLAYQKYALRNVKSLNNTTEDHIIFLDLESHSQLNINSLPKQQQQIFIMRTQDDLSMEEISKKLDISKRTVENHFYRACRKLKMQLRKQQII